MIEILCTGSSPGRTLGDDGVARLVERDDAALLVAHHALLLETGDDAIDRLVEVLAVDGGLVAARREQRRLVDEVGEVGAGESRGPRGDDLQLHVLRHLHVLDVDAQDFLAAADVRLGDQHLAVEAARAEQGRIEHLGPVGRGHDDDALAAVEAVHLGEQLVERLLALFVAAHRRLDADLAERVELVDEDDAGRLGFGLVEQIAHPGRADADEHLDELRAAQAEERHRRLAGHRAREQRLAGAGRADEEHALGDAPADAGVLARGLEELDDLAQFLLSLVHAGDVAEPHLHVVVRINLGAAAREGHDAAFGAAHAAEEEAPQGDQEDDRNDPAEQLRHPAAGDLAGVFDAVFLEVLQQLGILDAHGGEVPALFGGLLELPADPILGDGDLLDLALANEVLEVAVGNRLARLKREDEGVGERQEEKKSERVPHGGGRPGARREPPVTRLFSARVRSLR